MCKDILEIYAHYVQSSFGQITATGLSEVLDGEISHDKITRFLSERTYTGKDLWSCVKKEVRSLEARFKDSEQEVAVLIFDDHIEAKPHMDENDLIAWHYDHMVGKEVKGINQMSALYYIGGYSIPVDFDFVLKTEYYTDKKTGKQKRKSPESKNEKFRRMVKQAVQNDLHFKYVLMDIWFGSAQNMTYIKEDCGRDFITPLKSNRKIALSLEDKKAGKYQSLASLDIQTGEVYLEGVPFALTLVKEVFINKDQSMAERCLVTSDGNLDYEQITTIYQKRWKVEEHHKSIKSNLNYDKSPAHTARTQANHCFAVLYAFFDWEILSHKLKTNHFALKMKIYREAIKNAWKQIVRLKQNVTCA
jgi:hypothetical protein